MYITHIKIHLMGTIFFENFIVQRSFWVVSQVRISFSHCSIKFGTLCSKNAHIWHICSIFTEIEQNMPYWVYFKRNDIDTNAIWEQIIAIERVARVVCCLKRQLKTWYHVLRPILTCPGPYREKKGMILFLLVLSHAIWARLKFFWRHGILWILSFILSTLEFL